MNQATNWKREKVEAVSSIARIERAIQRVAPGRIESVLHLNLSNALAEAGIAHIREVPAPESNGRIDFVVDRISIEVKTAGSESAALSQIRRYLESDAYSGGVLITTRPWRTRTEEVAIETPEFFKLKPLRIIRLWRGALS